jgi:hypothetical protein
MPAQNERALCYLLFGTDQPGGKALISNDFVKIS